MTLIRSYSKFHCVRVTQFQVTYIARVTPTKYPAGLYVENLCRCLVLYSSQLEHILRTFHSGSFAFFRFFF